MGIDQGPEGTFPGLLGIVLHLDFGGGYTTVPICESSSNWTLEISAFIVI